MEKARRMLRESVETLKEGYGFSNQREACLKFENKRGLEIVEEHELVETSTTWSRQKFEEIIAKAIQERNEIPVIVFPRVDRFARNLQAAGYYLGLLRQNGLKIGFAEEDLMVDNEASAMTVLMFFIHSFKADQDGKQIKRNLLGGRDKLATQAREIPNGMVIWPFDYMSKRFYGKISTGRPTLNMERAAWVKKWADWILEEGVGLAEVCRRMNEAGVPTPRASRGWKGTGEKWQSKAVRDILRSEQLIGIFKWKGSTYIENGETVLTNEQFGALQKRLDDNREKSYYNATKLEYPPLPKMVFHACGQLMYGVPVNGKPYYRCLKCRKSYISAKDLWDDIRQQIRESLLSEDRLIPSVRSQLNNDDLIMSKEKGLREINERIKLLNDKWDALYRLASPDYPEDRFKKREREVIDAINRAKDEKVQIERELATLRQGRLDEEGIARLCRLVAKHIDNLTKNQWEMLNKLLKLKVRVVSKALAIVNVSLPPVRDTEIEFSRL